MNHFWDILAPVYLSLLNFHVLSESGFEFFSRTMALAWELLTFLCGMKSSQVAFRGVLKFPEIVCKICAHVFLGRESIAFLDWCPKVSILFYRYCYRVFFSCMQELFVI